MKSEFYREGSAQQQTRKSTAKQKHRKEPSSHINPIRMAPSHPPGRGLIRSIDLHPPARRETAKQKMLRMSFSRPAVLTVEQVVSPVLLGQKSIVSVCCKCEKAKSQHDKQIKALRMQVEEQKVLQTEKFIQMEKKYLLKESEVIRLLGDIRFALEQKTASEQLSQLYLSESQGLRSQLSQAEEEIGRLNDEIKKCQEQNRFFKDFLVVFTEQTQAMIHWCQLFDQSYQILPKTVTIVRDELLDRRQDLDLILKETIQYQQQNFGTPLSQSQTFFLNSEDDQDCSSFMKYLKQDPVVRVRHSRRGPFSEIKERHCGNDYSQNKENIDFTNRHCFQGLILSRKKEQVGRQKVEQMKDQLFRMLLTQAQTIELSVDSRCVGNNKSHFSVEGSLLSSISKKADHYLE